MPDAVATGPGAPASGGGGGLEHAPAVVFVDGGNVGGPWDGHTWSTAFRTVQEGLDAAAARVEALASGACGPAEGAEAPSGADAGRVDVWVAQGRYTPTGSGDRTASIRLRPGVDLYGGFVGDETRRDQRDWESRPTILSGAISADPAGYSLHVVVGADDALIDGFVIRDGRNLPEGPPPHHMSPELLLQAGGRGTGAGILNDRCAPTVRHCLICDNEAAKGAGMYNMVTREWPSVSPRRAPLVVGCTFARNRAVARGGAVCNDLETHPSFVECTFVDNLCEGKGGAMYNDFDCSPSLVRCLFARNEAAKGGAVANDGRSDPTITNCTFTRNHAREMYGAIYNGTGPTNVPNVATVTNSILWGDTAANGPAEIGNWHASRALVTYSCVQGGSPGEGNIAVDPMFADPEKGDYRLGPGSPCIDSGDGAAAPSRDRDGAQRRDDPGSPTGPRARVPYSPPGAHLPEPSMDQTYEGAADMGAFEFQGDSRRAERGGVVFVDAARGAAPADGLSWATAFGDLGRALGEAARSQSEVWVAAGVYRPTGDGDRRASFRLGRGVSVYGGFLGVESERDQRDPAINRTILSGDLGPGGRSYHVVIGADGAVLDGLVISDGCADGEGFDAHGAGLVNYNGSSPRIVACEFVGHVAREGAAVYNYNLASPVVEGCTFRGNRADHGAAMVCRVGSAPLVRDCRFEGNEAAWRGGALLIDYGSGPQLEGCSFSGNRSGGHGGAAVLESVAAQLGVVPAGFAECTFTDNQAGGQGGAVRCADGGDALFDRCTFHGNTAEAGGALAFRDHVSARVVACSFSGNRARAGMDDIDSERMVGDETDS